MNLLRWRRVADGVDVDCLVGGEAHTYHQQSGLISSDAEAVAFAAACAAAEPVADTVSITCEDGTVINA